MDEYICAAAIRLNEAKATFFVVVRDNSVKHIAVKEDIRAQHAKRFANAGKRALGS